MVAVNRELMDVYRDIGKTIHEQQQTAEWGSSVVEQLAKDLKKSFAGMRGFSSRNLWNMRDFYLSYADNQKLQAMTAEISWTHNVVVFEKCKDPLQREFYIRMSKRNGWTYRVLMNQNFAIPQETQISRGNRAKSRRICPRIHGENAILSHCAC